MAQSISNTVSNNYPTLRGIKASPKAKSLYGQNVGLNQLGDVVKKTTTPTVGLISPNVTKNATASTAPAQLSSINNTSQLSSRGTSLQTPQNVRPTKGLFESVLGSLAQSKTSPAQNKYLDELGAASRGGVEIGQQAREIAGKYAPEIARVGQLGAGAQAGALSTGTDVVGRGNAAIASQSASQRIAALSDALTAELQGTGQQLTGQEQLISGMGTALGATNVQQQLAQQAQQAAAQYSQPTPTSFGQTVFDPLTGTFKGGGGGLEPQAAAQQLAQAVKSGQMTYEQAVQSLGYAGGAGQQFLNQALGQGFNIPLSTATIGGQADVIGQLPQLYAADTAAEGIKDQIVTYLSSNPSLNPTELKKVNFFNQWVAGQVSDPKYQTLANLLNEYTNTLAPILGVGGDPTNLKTEIAQSFINAGASGQSIATVLNNIQALSKGKLQNMQSGAMGGGVVSSPTLPGLGGHGGSGGQFDW